MSVTIRNLTIAIGGKTIVSHVDLDIADGERVGLIGSSGSGKSMIAKAMMGLLPATAQVSGSIEMGGRRIVGATDADIADLRGRYVGMVFQNPAAALNPVMTVAQQIGLPLYLHYDLTAAERAERIRVMLAKVGLDEDVLRKYPHELSGGQQQRVACARAMMARPSVIFADEPTGNLDSRSSREVLGFLRDSVRDYGQSIVMVTHDPRAASFADRVLVLADGEITRDMSHPTYADILEVFADDDEAETTTSTEGAQS